MSIGQRGAQQLTAVVTLLQASLGSTLLGAYLYGSAVKGGLKPASDLDVFVVIRERTSPEQRQLIINGLRPLSARTFRPPAWHPVELTVVVASEVKPWRYPPRMDFQSGEWLRQEFDTESLGVQDAENPDLIVLVSQVLLADKPLSGPGPAELLDPPPRRYLRRAMLDGIEHLLDDLESDTANVLLTLARIWVTLTTGEFVAKDAAAKWAAARLGAGSRAALDHARAIYLGEADDVWPGRTATSAAAQMVERIRRPA